MIIGKNQEHWNSSLRFHLATKGSAVGIRAWHLSTCEYVVHSIAEGIKIAVAYKIKS